MSTRLKTYRNSFLSRYIILQTSYKFQENVHVHFPRQFDTVWKINTGRKSLTFPGHVNYTQSLKDFSGKYN